MSTTAPVEPGPSSSTPNRGQILAWGLWDWGSAAFNAVIVTFVFSVYLTDAVGSDLPGPVSANSWLGWALGLSGLLIALLAPVSGQRADAGGRRRLSLAVWTGLVVVCTLALFFVRNDYTYLWLGLVLFGLGSIFFELAEVSYNAMLRQISTPANIGRVSGFGWSMGYLGGIVLLLGLYTLFIAGSGDTRGLLNVSTEDGLNIRIVAIVAAVWFLVFALPVFLKVPEIPGRPESERVGFFASYARLVRHIRELYRTNPHTVYFLGASALFRDGLAAIFTFGAVLAVTVYGVDPGVVLLFGVAANVLAALGAIIGGRLDDVFGPKPVIMASLVGLLASGTVLLFLSGPTAFWIFGLALTMFVGPAQSSSRTFLARLAQPGQEGELFGLYATTGRAVSFLAPTLFAFFTLIFGSDRAGIVGILLVLALGLLALWPVRPPAIERTAEVKQQPV